METKLFLDQLDNFDLSDELFCILDREGSIQQINPKAWEETLGYAKSELVDSSLYSLLSEDEDSSDLIKRISSSQNNSKKLLTKKFIGKNKEIVWLSCSIKVATETDLVFLTARNITEELQNHSDRQTQTSVLLDLNKDARLFSTDLNVALKIITEAAAKTLDVNMVSVWFYNKDRTAIEAFDHYNKQKEEHNTGLILTSEEYPTYFKSMEQNRIIDANDARKDPRTSEFTENYLTPSGIYAMLDAPIFYKGESVGVLCHEHINETRKWSDQEKAFASSLADLISTSLAVSEILKMAEKVKSQNTELEKINNELDHFVYSSSHQLRAPIASIRGIINLLQNPSTHAENSEYVEMLERSILKMDETISEINSYYKNLKTGIAKKNCSFKELIQRIWEDVLLLQPADNIDFKIKVNFSDPVWIDEYRVSILLSNLFSNSIKYRDQLNPSLVEVNADNIEDNLIIYVQDNGIGIPKQYQNNVFDIFFRASTIKDGTGLGLFIVKEVIEKLEGDISIDSRENEFTRFNIRIPLVTKEEAPAHASVSTPDSIIKELAKKDFVG